MDTMSDQSAPPTKPVSREGKFSKLRALACFDEVHDKICKGWPMPEVAKFIQEENGEYTEIQRDTLINTLKEYRQSIPPAELAAQRIPSVVVEAAAKVRKGLDEIEALEDLYQLQLDRIAIDHDVEKTIKKLIPTMTQEVRVAREILQTYSDLKMDLGLSKRHLGQLDVDTKLTAEVVGQYNKPSVTKVMSNPESRRKVLSVTEKILQLAARKLPASEQTVEVPAGTPDPEPVKE